MADTSATCEGDPTGVTCLMQELGACGDLAEVEGTKVTVNRYWVGCHVMAIQMWACPLGGPCSDAVGIIWDRCEDSGVCDLYREAIRFVLDRVPPTACIDLVCPTS